MGSRICIQQSQVSHVLWRREDNSIVVRATKPVSGVDKVQILKLRFYFTREKTVISTVHPISTIDMGFLMAMSDLFTSSIS